MTEKFVAILEKLVAEYGKAVFDDAESCQAFLTNYARKAYKREIKILTDVLQRGYLKMLECSDPDIEKKVLAGMLRKDGIEIRHTENVLSCLCYVMFGDVAVSKHVSNTFIDPRDGKAYKAVKIGKLVWMAENLNYDAIESKCYENNPANAIKYGRLYDWESAKEATPPGWHLPTDAEWQTLVDFAGGYEFAGAKLKAGSGWEKDGQGTDDYGFSALPGGYGYSAGTFSYAGYNGFWWSATQSNNSNAYCRYIYYNSKNAYWDIHNKTGLFSVRCVLNK